MDGTEVVIAEAAGLGAFLEQQEILDVDGIPMLNCVTCAIKMASGNFMKGYEQRYTLEATPSGNRFTCSEGS